MKLELKHLASYLPYGIHLMNEYGRWHNTTLNKGLSIYQMIEMKPILRPLSDLTKEIEVNGEKFVPVKYLAFKNDIDSIIEFQNGFLHNKAIKFGIIERLLEWHFDVYGLIKNGLAIDINTL